MAQQQGSVLRKFFRVEPMKGEFRYFDRVHPTDAIKVTSKYMDTPMLETQFSRRAVFGTDYIWADMVDNTDEPNLFIDPKSSITEAGMLALGRILDKIIIDRVFDGDAREGKSGEVIVPFPEKQVIPITVGGTGGANAGLTVEKLRAARSMFGKANIDLKAPGNDLVIVVSQEQIDDLAKGIDIRNSLYEAVMALVTGKTDTFLGFKFVQTQLLNTTAIPGSETAVSRRCAAFVKSGSLLVLPRDIQVKVSERDDKCANWQVLAKMKAGATRLEDETVIAIPCEEAI
ncbi:MAG: phage capsid protein [Victivallaceae bacterium]|nr:phage capsid protein [Victivallaceae bacterium]